MKSNFIKEFISKKLFFLVLLSISLLLTTATHIKAQLPKAEEIASEMRVGWNMGNTLEAIGGETAWGGAKTTQALIDFVKSSGFNTVRIPVAWFDHADTLTSVIDEAWMTRVQEVVNYCINADLYVIINMHWDHGWLENRVNTSNRYIVDERLFDFWTQIATCFVDYDERLLFAGTNEPNVESGEQMGILETFHQTFIDAVRATGGNNSSRTLIIQGPSTDIDKTNRMMNILPEDEIEDRLMVEVHYYTPYQFCLMENDANWGKVFYYWGKDFHSSSEPSRNANWGEEAEMERLFGLMESKFVKNGIPVILGEFGAYKRNLGASSDQELHEASVDFFNKYVVKTALSKGLIPYYWDTNMGLFDRAKNEVLDQSLLDAMMEGLAEADISSSNNKLKQISTIELYPNPFANELTIQLKASDYINQIEVIDLLGNIVERINGKHLSGSVTVAQKLSPGAYFIKVHEQNGIKTTKVLKIKN